MLPDEIIWEKNSPESDLHYTSIGLNVNKFHYNIYLYFRMLLLEKISKSSSQFLTIVFEQ